MMYSTHAQANQAVECAAAHLQPAEAANGAVLGELGRLALAGRAPLPARLPVRLRPPGLWLVSLTSPRVRDRSPPGGRGFLGDTRRARLVLAALIYWSSLERDNPLLPAQPACPECPVDAEPAVASSLTGGELSLNRLHPDDLRLVDLVGLPLVHEGGRRAREPGVPRLAD